MGDNLSAVETPDTAESYDLRWIETMRGSIVVGSDVHRGSSARDGAVPLEFRVVGKVESMEVFLRDPNHELRLGGWISSDLIGGQRPVESGSLSLFAPTRSDLVAELTYELPFHDANGAPFLLSGYKTVRDDRGFDFWADTSRLDVTLHAGHDVSSPVVGRGVLRISVLGFLALFLSMRVGKESVEEDSEPQNGWFHRAVRQIWCRTRFNVWFLRQLAKFYGNPFVVKAAALQIRGDRIGGQVRAALEFDPQSRVRWADPRVLVRTALNLRRATDLGDMIDARQLQHPRARPYRELAGDSEVWVDFIADTGDGFAASYSVAYTAARECLDVGNTTTHRGRALVLGGDLVYPTPTQRDYDNRLVGPFAAALPYDNQENHIALAIPGNHDWYDSLKWFSHYFMTPGCWLGGRKAVQRQSYFAVELPHGWWLLGFDIALDLRVDDRQVAFFKSLRRKLDRQGARVILVVAKPAWIQDPDSNEAKNLGFIERELVPRGTLAAVLCGDVHHCSRYGNPHVGPTRICCGGGDTYTAGTHHLKSSVPRRLGPKANRQRLPLTQRYPSRADSLRARKGVVTALIRRLSFVVAAAAVLLLLVGSVLADDVWEPVSTIDKLRTAGVVNGPEVVGRGLLGNPIALAVWSVFVLALLGYGWSGRRRAGWFWALTAGILHVAVQLMAVVVLLWVFLRVDVHGTLDAITVIAGMAVVGASVAALFARVLPVPDRHAGAAPRPRLRRAGSHRLQVLPPPACPSRRRSRGVRLRHPRERDDVADERGAAHGRSGPRPTGRPDKRRPRSFRRADRTAALPRSAGRVGHVPRQGSGS